VCAQCHVEYYFAQPGNMVTYPWSGGIRVEEIEAYYDERGFSAWQHGMTGAPVLKAQHPEFELFSQGTHAQAGVSCADCHMPYIREGALKVSDHHVRSPLLNIARACQTCHSVPENELLARAHAIQDRTESMIKRAAAAVSEMIDAIVAAGEAGVSQEDLAAALQMQRRAQWRLDFVFSEGSHGFHADQEAARILAEAMDYARQGQLYATAAAEGRVPVPPPVAEPPELGSATPKEESPPHPPERL
jgi:nitrite reductase (cytochrome c-552)